MDHEQNCIKDFMIAGDQTVRTTPTTDITYQEKLLRIKLMCSELSELIDAMASNNLIGIADGIADLIYVVKGTAITYGIDIEPIFNEVQRSNMSKCIGNKLIKDSSGKVLKPNSYSPPQLQPILDKQITTSTENIAG